jgi:hypothetical protein
MALHLDKTQCSPAGRHSFIVCRCDCGREVSIHNSALSRGSRTSCGCDAEHNLEGKRFGNLVVLGIDHNATGGNGHHRYWRCRCDCGDESRLRTHQLTGGNRRACCACRAKQRQAEHATPVPSVSQQPEPERAVA